MTSVILDHYAPTAVVLLRSLCTPTARDESPILNPSLIGISVCAHALVGRSDEAIEELITLAFESADLVHQDRMTFDEFKKWATTDVTIIAWFDSLGSVF